MTSRTLERGAAGIPDYVIGEDEIARRCQMTMTEWRLAAVRLEAAGFPPIHPILGKRLRARVDQWFDGQTGLAPMGPAKAALYDDGEENWGGRRRRARA
ncbi:hypothetical protein [Phreatobacter oligotrophus]|uniref:Uncharacterized protein n=1 Tax=Phreatobacter oligotrophus TaxID=1122261 RepID=A0A2T4ZIR4_9HYPH|nr:hypothetical protein [Phreatobacter oligotrophus]PTM61861.1 hypothetical protein C8P69_101533 [Phreatobacter oligotrophus]